MVYNVLYFNCAQYYIFVFLIFHCRVKFETFLITRRCFVM